MHPAITVTHVRKTFAEVVAVNDISFDVQGGEIFGLLGPNGAGKTTTIRMLMDILRPDSGQIRLLGDDPRRTRTRVGYLPEERGLYRTLKVHECLAYLGQLKGLTTRQAKDRATALLTRLELADRAQAKVQDLSRGMQQKAQIAAALIHDPELVIFDEPFQGLDPVNVDLVRGLIRELRDQGRTVVLSAHEMSLVEALCERIAMIHRGGIVLYGKLADIQRRHAPDAVEFSPPLEVADWPEVASAQAIPGGQRLYLQTGVTRHQFLQAVLARGLTPERFAQAAMPLDEIFVRVVKGTLA